MILFFVALHPSLIAQSEKSLEKSIFSYGLSFHQAFILVHSVDVRPIEDSYPIGMQMDFSWQQRSLESWNKCRCFPKIGASVQLWDFDNPDILGYGMNAYFFVEPEYGSSNFINFSFRAGFGGSLLTNPYDEIDNPSNQSYSTHLAFSLILAIKAGFRLSDKTRFEISPYYNHISNGGVKDPNKGINYPSLSLGFSHFLGETGYNNYAKSDWDKDNRLQRLDITPFISWKQMEDDVHVFSPGIEIKGSTQVGKINALTLGVEYLEDNFAKFRFEKSGVYGEWRKISTAVGHEFLLGRLNFSQQLGIYLYNPDWNGDILYQRYGLVFNWTNRFGTGVNLKAHRNVADLIDFRFVFSF